MNISGHNINLKARAEEYSLIILWSLICIGLGSALIGYYAKKQIDTANDRCFAGYQNMSKYCLAGEVETRVVDGEVSYYCVSEGQQ